MWFWLKASHEVLVKMSAQVLVSDGLTGAGGATSQMVHSHGWRVNTDCWKEA